MEDRKQVTNTRQIIGLILAISGISCMGIVKVLIGVNTNTLSVIIIISSLLLTINYELLRRGILLMPYSDMGLFTLFSIVSLAYCVLSGSVDPMSHYGIVYQVFYFVQIVAVWNLQEIDERIFTKLFFWFEAIANLLAAYVVLTNYMRTGILFFNNLGNETINRSTVGALSFTLVCALLVYPAENQAEKAIKVIMWGVGFFNLTTSSRRTVILSLILVAILHLRNQRRGIEIRTFIIILLGLIVIVPAIILAFNRISVLKDMLDHTLKILNSGINTMLGRSQEDMSAIYRRNGMGVLLQEYLHESSFMQIIFGRGYMKGWVDLPYLQAFYDMGIIGGVLFIAAHMIIPIKYLVRRVDNPGSRIAQYLVALQFVENFVSGTPYGELFPLVLFAVFQRSVQNATVELEEY